MNTNFHEWDGTVSTAWNDFFQCVLGKIYISFSKCWKIWLQKVPNLGKNGAGASKGWNAGDIDGRGMYDDE
jgi:hypothetical protein